MSGEVTYCDDYEQITGKKIPSETAEQGQPQPAPTIETKVIEAPTPPPVAPATLAETA